MEVRLLVSAKSRVFCLGIKQIYNKSKALVHITNHIKKDF